MGGLLESLRRDGWHASIHRHREYQPSDLCVVWGARNSVMMDAQRHHGGLTLIAERAYVGDRFHWSSLGYGGLNGRADFCNANVCGDRWQRYFVNEMQPPRSGGKYVLLIGQVPRDAALSNLPGHTLDPWIKRMQAELPSLYGLPVRYRPHPQVAPVHTTLEQDLIEAAFCVTYNSNSGVIAALAGVPVVAVDKGSMAWAVAARAPDPNARLPDRTDWAAKLAYCQWTPREISDGTAWAHLRQAYA